MVIGQEISCILTDEEAAEIKNGCPDFLEKFRKMIKSNNLAILFFRIIVWDTESKLFSRIIFRMVLSRARPVAQVDILVDSLWKCHESQPLALF